MALTEFGRALHALNIDIICANSSQAKGRVGRVNATLQDRLVKEMRLLGISSMEAGNAFLLAFMTDYNARFAKPPFGDRDLHRSCADHDDLDDAFAWKEERSVSVNLTLQYDQVMFILEPTNITRPLARKRVMVIDYPDGRLAIRHNGVICPIGLLINGRGSIRRRSLRTNGSVRFWPTLPRSRKNLICPVRPRPPGVVARQITCSKSDRHKEFRTTTRKGGYLTSLGVTFETGSESDFPKWCRHGMIK